MVNTECRSAGPTGGLRALAALALAALSPPPAGAALAVGDQAEPVLSGLPAAAGMPATSGKVVLLDFWASWCAPCKASFPAYSRLSDELSASGLVIVAISVDDDAAAYDAFVRRLKPTFFVARDPGHRLVERVQVPTMPTCYLIDRRGRVRSVHPGFREGGPAQAMRREIVALLAEEAP